MALLKITNVLVLVAVFSQAFYSIESANIEKYSSDLKDTELEEGGDGSSNPDLPDDTKEYGPTEEYVDFGYYPEQYDEHNLTCEFQELEENLGGSVRPCHAWSEGYVFYRFGSEVCNISRYRIKKAIYNWKLAVPCLHFVELTSPPCKLDPGHIEFHTNYKECYSSSVGYTGCKPHIINITPRCSRLGSILRLIGYVLGFWPEVTRPDRDKYVIINKYNIIPKYRHMFRKNTASQAESYGTKYDYKSLMHYSTNAFGKGGCKTISVNDTTLYAKEGYPVLGQNCGLSIRDIVVMNKFYRCDKEAKKMWKHDFADQVEDEL